MAAATMFDRVLVPRHTVARVLAAIVLGTVMLLTANYAISKRFGVSPGGYGIVAAMFVEVVFTALLVYVVLATTSRRFPVGFGGLAAEIAQRSQSTYR